MRTSAPTVGELEHLLLLAVLQCQRDGTDAYTVPIRQQLVERTGRAIARGAVHTSLDRLENKGLVTSAMGDPVAIRGGRARRYYTVTTLGLNAVRHAQAAVQTLSAGLDTLLVNSGKSGSSRF